MAVNGALNGRCSYSSSELLAWLNESLQTNFTEVQQVCTGAAFCQLMDWLYPGSLDLFNAQFHGNFRMSCIINLNLLQTAFKKVGLNRHIPIESLLQKSSTEALMFLQWFKELFDEKHQGRKYHALEARRGQSLVPGESDKHSTSHPKAEGPQKDNSMESFKNNPDVILLISDDDDVVDVTTEQKTDELMDVCVPPSQLKKFEEAAAEKNTKGMNLYSDYKWLQFVKKYFCVSVDTAHIKHAIQACSHTPYCLYLYLRVELDGGRSTSAVLIGYLDQNLGVRVVMPLFTLQMSVDRNTADIDNIRAASDARLLIDCLKKVDLNLSNLAVFHCNAPHPGASQEFVSQLQAYSPRLISLCGLPGMAARACQAALLASFACVVDLIKDIHHHYSTCCSVNDSVKELFAETESYNPARPIAAQCLFIIQTVQKMVKCWRDLVEYFKSLRDSEDADRIRTQLMDHKVKLHFLFLSHTLEPLRALQELQQHGIADLVVELHLASMLVHSYSNSIFRPRATTRFARSREVHLLHDENELLPVTEVTIGSLATDFLWATPVVDLQEQDRTKFLLDAQTFYKEALQSLVESIPEQLGEVALRNINKLLKHPEGVSGTNGQQGFTELSELCAQLGLYDAKPADAHGLVVNYLSCVQSVTKEQKRSKEEGHWWAQLLHRVRAHSTLHRVLLILLALPVSLQRIQVFSKVVRSVSALQASKETSKAPHDPAKWARATQIHKRKTPVQARHDGRKKDEEDGKSSSEDTDSAAAKLSGPKSAVRSGEDSEYTDNSSDIVDVTDETATSRTSRLMKKKRQRPPPAESVYIISSDEEDYHMDSTSTPPSSAPSLDKSDIKGEMVWGHMDGFSLWPAVLIPFRGDTKLPGMRMVQWYGQNMTSQVRLQSLKPFAFFSQHFCGQSFATLATYREAVFLSLQEAAVRSKKEFSACPKDQDDLLKQMLDWAFGGFQPLGADGLKPAASINGNFKDNRRLQVKKKLLMKGSPSPISNKRSMSAKVRDMADSMKMLSCDSTDTSSQSKWEKDEDWGRGGQEKMKAGWGKTKGGRVPKKKSSLLCGFDDDMSPDFVPAKKRNYTRTYNKVNQASSVYEQPDQKLREETIRRIMDSKLDIEGYCLCCGTEDVLIFHPLFKGSLCLKCKNNFTETLYRYDEDGYQSYCTICCYGMEVILCGNDSCCRSYCEDCLNILVGPGTFDSLKELDPWVCYLCQTHQPHGALTPREDWSIRVQELFANNSAMEFEPHRVYPSIPANQRRPLRVLSLFDGIATGYLVLKELGFKVEKYVASEVCEDSLAVATVNHDGKIIHVGDARFITEQHLTNWGPFDLLIGGSPCNDLSIVNPLRKGLYEGTGRLFFEFYRILQLLKPREDDPRPFFWLFENVVFMNTHDKVNICRFLECNPVLVDAVKVSPAHRARYFWGNIPGMSRPIIASQSDKLNLQDCLEIGREARMTKVRTITTNPNSLKQGKGVSQLPVLENGREDILWITELEKIFGFPKHYTDVRNMNRQQRQKVLGKAWSVPVIRHLFAPLKDYFACEELPPVSTSTLKASTSTPSPASPEAQQG